MNHMYLIALETYTEAGSGSGNMAYVYKDNPVDFAHAVTAYQKETQENGMKKYKVTPQILAYSTIADMAEFCRVNHIAL